MIDDDVQATQPVSSPAAPPGGVTVIHPPRRTEIGLGAIIFGAFTSVCLGTSGCWWALPCSIVGIVLGVTVSNSKLSKCSNKISLD